MLSPSPLPLPTDSWLARARLIPGATSRVVGAGQVVRAGHRPSTTLVLVESGAVALSLWGPDGRAGILCVLGRGAVLGHEALADGWMARGMGGPERLSVDHDLRPERLTGEGGLRPERPTGEWGLRPDPLTGEWGLRPEGRALVASRITSIPAPEVARAVERRPSLAAWILASLDGLVRLLERRLVETLTLGVRDRTLALLQDLAAAHGRRTAGGLLVGLPLTQEVLAGMVGATRESVNRALRDLARSGRVRRAGRHYVVISPSSPGSPPPPGGGGAS